MQHNKILKRMIILCWTILICCFIIKLLGGNYFQAVINNNIYQAICSYVDTHLWLQCVIGSLSTTVLNTLFLLAINRKLNFTKGEWILVISSSVLGAIIKVINPYIGIAFDFYQYFILPFLIKPSTVLLPKIRSVLFGNILVLLFQIVSAVTKNLGVPFATQDLVAGLIWMLDLYIMCILYYLYANLLKGEITMGWIASWLWGKSETQLERMKKTRLEKIAKNDENTAKLKEEIGAIDAEIAKKRESKN